jgi:Mn-dependent DtxR family transcriptional regulator
MKIKSLTPREQECLDVIKAYYKENRVIPTHVYIADKMGVGRQYATLLISKLVAKKALKATARYGLYQLV